MTTLEDIQKARALDKIRAQRAADQQAQPPMADPLPVQTAQSSVVQAPTLDNRFAGAVRGVRERIDGTTNALMRGATLGLYDDEARAGLASAIGYDYDENLQRERAEEAKFAEQHPVLNTTAEIMGGLAIPGGSASRLANRVRSRVAVGAATGAASGSVYGFMEGEGDDRPTNAALTGGLGALFGAAAPKISDVVTGLPQKVVNLFSRSQERPTLEVLRATKNAAYDAVESAGEVFAPDDMTALSQRIQQIAADDVGYVVGEDTAVDAAIRTLTRREGQETTLSQLDRIRQRLFTRVNRNPDQVQIYDFIGAIDELIDSRAEASSLMTAARAANARFSKSELLETAFQRAQDQTASTGSGGNILNKYRQAVTSIMNGKQARFFSDDEISMMRNFVNGSVSENVLRRVGKLSPSGNGLMLMLHATGGVLSGGATIPFAIAGSSAKTLADRSARRGSEEVVNVLSGGIPTPRNIPITGGQAAAIAASPSQTENAQSSIRRRLSR